MRGSITGPETMTAAEGRGSTHWCPKALCSLPVGKSNPVSRVTSGDTHHYTKEDWLLGHVLIGFLYLWRGDEAGTAGRRLPATPHSTWNTLFPMSPSAPSESQHVSQVCKTGYKANSLGSAPCSATAPPWDSLLPCL